MQRELKYPIVLFFIILFAKFSYVIIESYYNYHVLITTTSADITKKAMDELNQNGHLISASGITLLLIPFVFLLVKRKPKRYIYKFMAISVMILFTLSYNLLNVAVDKIVQYNKGKRYEAFYVNVFKYGLLNRIFSYDSFVNIDKNITISDRMLLTNTFLLLHADEDLIDKLKQRGKEKVVDIYISKYLKDDYEKKYNSLKNASEDISKLWDSFNKSRKELKTKLDDVNGEKKIKSAHKDMINSLKANFGKYKEYDKLVAKKTNPRFVADIKVQLQKYFRYRRFKRAQNMYESRMQKEFGHYIEPYRWRGKGFKVTDKRVRTVILEEIDKKVKNELIKKLPRNMDAQDFADNMRVKIEFAKELKKKGVLVPLDFDFSYTLFKKYYELSVADKINGATKKFYKELEKKIGKNDMRLDFTWSDFVYSDYIKNNLQKNVKYMDKKDFANILKIIKSKDLGNFKKLIYLPKVIDKVDRMIYSKKDFEDGEKASEYGDEAIKLLYIPPFALSVSILALLLNSITVIGMVLEYKNISKFKIVLTKVALFMVIVTAPFVLQYSSFNNELIKQASTPQIENYLDFLNWISFYETINYYIHK